MIPISDENPHNTFPAVTIGLMALIVIGFALEFIADAHGMIDQVVERFAVIPELLMNDSHESSNLGGASLVTYMFLHSGWMHIVPNLLFLWIFGDNIEDAFGRVRFALFFLVSGAVSGLAHCFFAGFGSDLPLIGASGAISAVLGAYFMLFPKARVRLVFPTILFAPPLVLFGAPFLWFFTLPAVIFLGLWFASDIYQAFFVGGDTVSFWAHISGFAFGLLAARFLRRPDETSLYSRMRADEMAQDIRTRTKRNVLKRRYQGRN